MPAAPATAVAPAVAIASSPSMDGLGETPWPGPIVAFGDSYTAGFGVPAGESYPAALAAALGLTVVNRGASGETAAESLPRLQADVVALRPRLAIVAFGANEALRGQPIASCVEALDALLAELGAHRVPVLLVGVHQAGYQEEFDDALRALAAKHGAGLVLDVLDGLMDDPRYAGLHGHPNGPGYGVMAGRIRPEAERMLAG